MASAYPNNYDEERPRPEIVYIDPHIEEDPQRTPERLDSAMQRTAEYVAGLGPNVDTYHPGNYTQHHHDSHGLPPLTIRRHAPGSNDPSLQKFPLNLQPISENISSSTNLRVTIKRNPVTLEPPVIQPVIQPVMQPMMQPVMQPMVQPIMQPMIQPVMQPVMQPAMQPVIQPVFYPVAVYVNSPVAEYPVQQPVEPSPPKQEAVKPKSPVKVSPIPPMSANRYETELLRTPGSRNTDRNTSTRRPVRLDLITPTPPASEPRKVRSSQMVVEEFNDYDEYYRVPPVFSVPGKVVSYRTAPGMSTRELENDQMDHSGEAMPDETPQLKTITYRAS